MEKLLATLLFILVPMLWGGLMYVAMDRAHRKLRKNRNEK